MKKSGLGRGLGAFFVEEDSAGGESVIELSLDMIDPDQSQPRKRFAQDALEQLAASIKSVGVLQPILVYPKDGRFTIIAGERRWRAARIAELSAIPAIIRDLDQVRRMEIALIENLQREDLNALEEASGVRQLMDECGLTQQAVADRLGKSRSAVANTLRLLDMPLVIQELVREGKLTAGHARAAAMAKDPETQQRVAAQAVDYQWSVRQTEDSARKASGKKAAGIHETSLATQMDSEVREFIERVSQVFGTRAYIKSTQTGSGQLVLPYQSLADLERFDDVINAVISRQNTKNGAR